MNLRSNPPPDFPKPPPPPGPPAIETPHWRDTARLDLIERTQSYPWPDYGGVWKFRDAQGRRFVAPTLRGVLDAALAAEVEPLE